MLCSKVVTIHLKREVQFVPCNGELEEVSSRGPNKRQEIDYVCKKCRQVTSLAPLIVDNPNQGIKEIRDDD